MFVREDLVVRLWGGSSFDRLRNREQGETHIDEGEVEVGKVFVGVLIDGEKVVLQEFEKRTVVVCRLDGVPVFAAPIAVRTEDRTGVVGVG